MPEGFSGGEGGPWGGGAGAGAGEGARPDVPEAQSPTWGLAPVPPITQLEAGLGQLGHHLWGSEKGLKYGTEDPK